jgi:hypothetical protein
MLNLIKKKILKFYLRDIDELKFQIGNSYFSLLNYEITQKARIDDFSYKVFSQNGEDGIIDFLLSTLKISSPKFVEIGVEDYTECNTRYIFQRHNACGLIIDGTKNLLKKVQNNPYYFKKDLRVHNEYISSENIFDILTKQNFISDVDLFSIDIDGIDYWILDSLPVNYFKIVVVEYNPLFSDKEITVPNIKNFDRRKYHFSNLCYGMSLKAAINLLVKKDMIFIGSNDLKNNAFFINKKYLNLFKLNLPSDSEISYFLNFKYKESRDELGKLTYLNKERSLDLIKDCKVINLSNSKTEEKKIKDIFDL